MTNNNDNNFNWFLLSTQYRENYAYADWNGEGECPEHWKCKGGVDYIIRAESAAHARIKWEAWRIKNNMVDSKFSTETVLDIVKGEGDPNAPTREEQEQLDFAGEIYSPARRILDPDPEMTQERIEINHANWSGGRCYRTEYTVDVFKEEGEFFAMRVYVSTQRGVGHYELNDGSRFPANAQDKARARLTSLLGLEDEDLKVFKDELNQNGERVVKRGTPYRKEGVPSNSRKITATYEASRVTDFRNATFL